ncbi:unnamed protein product [Somion occarium]|uniref:Uncharacterized protein n=1 Tax=Somion occarium TaxID=3059160 RepID=A0ABP1DIL5_9APHY
MIILDNDAEQLPKLASPTPAYSPPVNRCSTPTSSLPDYDASEALHHEIVKPRRKHISRCWRVVICIVFVYCFLTLAIGVPLLVVKLKSRDPEPAPPPSVWSPQQANVIAIPGQELADNPPAFEDEDDCDRWTVMDRMHGKMVYSCLNYSIPLSGDIFIGSNGSFKADGPYSSISGTLYVDINEDPSVDDMHFTLSMIYTHTLIRERTHVCRTNTMDNSGVYIYVPDDLDSDDGLDFDVTLKLPQPRAGLNYTSFATMLPLFYQHYADISPRIKFKQVFLGGPKSTVFADSFAADNLAVMTSPGNISGSFQASYQLIMETIPISVNVTMSTSGDWAQPIVRLNTGDSPLSAHVTLVPRKGRKNQKFPTYYLDVNTFSSPLYLSVSQSPPSSEALPVFVHAGNNLGEVTVKMDNHYQGTFIAQTEYARTVVLDTCSNCDTEDMSSNSTFVKTLPDSIEDGFGRTLYYDSLADSSVSGWVGKGSRPSTITTSGSPGCIEVMSVLSPVTLELGQSSS